MLEVEHCRPATLGTNECVCFVFFRFVFRRVGSRGKFPYSQREEPNRANDENEGNTILYRSSKLSLSHFRQWDVMPRRLVDFGWSVVVKGPTPNVESSSLHASHWHTMSSSSFPSPARAANSSSSVTMVDLIDSLRIRLLLALWAGSLLLLLSALYDLPTMAHRQQHFRGSSLSHAVASEQTPAGNHHHQQQLRLERRWTPFLEEEARTIDMLSHLPLQFLGLTRH